MTQTKPDTNDQNLAGAAAVEKIRKILNEFRSTMMVTRSGGEIRSRPMGLLGSADDFNGTLWFFADDRSGKMNEISGGQSVWLLFQNDKESAYLELAGTATEDKDRGRMEDFYTPLIRTWFPQGLNDPHLTLIRFDAEHGHFWESPGGMLQVLAALTKSVVTGSPGKAGSTGDLNL